MAQKAMHIPRAWTKVSADGRLPEGKVFPVSIWGWGDDESAAKASAADRLKRVLERIRLGESFPDQYAYGNRPLREEILQTLESSSSDEPSAIVTRNSYGAQVLNTARLLFLDIDIRPPSFAQRLQRLFGGVSAEEDPEQAP
jgi:hypothetical protein